MREEGEEVLRSEHTPALSWAALAGVLAGAGLRHLRPLSSWILGLFSALLCRWRLQSLAVLLRLFAPLALLLRSAVFWAIWGISCTLPVKACSGFFGGLYLQRPWDPSANGCKENAFHHSG